MTSSILLLEKLRLIYNPILQNWITYQWRILQIQESNDCNAYVKGYSLTCGTAVEDGIWTRYLPISKQGIPLEEIKKNNNDKLLLSLQKDHHSNHLFELIATIILSFLIPLILAKLLAKTPLFSANFFSKANLPYPIPSLRS